jgi:hypothetical protein
MIRLVHLRNKKPTQRIGETNFLATSWEGEMRMNAVRRFSLKIATSSYEETDIRGNTIAM